jgi:hypothetical protein
MLKTIPAVIPEIKDIPRPPPLAGATRIRGADGRPLNVKA